MYRDVYINWGSKTTTLWFISLWQQGHRKNYIFSQDPLRLCLQLQWNDATKRAAANSTLWMPGYTQTGLTATTSLQWRLQLLEHYLPLHDKLDPLSHHRVMNTNCKHSSSFWTLKWGQNISCWSRSVHTRQGGLTTAWVDCKKACNSVPHSCTRCVQPSHHKEQTQL